MSDRADSKIFEDVIQGLLERGLSSQFEARGRSMSPAIRDGETVEVSPVSVRALSGGEIILVKSDQGFQLHRVTHADYANDRFITRGDCGHQDDPPLSASQILGIARAKQVRIGNAKVTAGLQGILGSLLRCAARGQYLASKLAGRTTTAASHRVAFCGRTVLLFSLLIVFLAVSTSQAQVAVDATANATAELAGTGTQTLTITHNTGSGANRLLIVSVSMNLSNSNTSQVSGVRYNGAAGTPLTLLGAHNDAGNTRRVEMWYLLNPASGTNIPIIVSVINLNKNKANGVVATSTTFTGVDQTTPLGNFVSADGANGANSQLDVPSVVNGMVLDTLATGGDQTVTVPAWQTQQWNARSGAAANADVTGTGSTRAGNPSLPFSETFSGTSNWALGAVSINPTTADISVSTSVAAVAFGTNSTYSVTVTNNGPSPANSISLTDTFANANLSLISFSGNNGAICSLATTINCSLATLNKGSSFTLTVTVSTSTPGYYPNTATVTDSGTPPDPNTGNNTYVALAPVLTTVCSDNSPPAGNTLASGVLNTYFPGTASVTAGSTSIPIGTANGTGAITSGSLLLVIQMQDASINTSNTVAYGNGYTGTGFTTINNAGNYEFVTALGAVSGGSVSIAGAGANGGLVFSYTAAAATGTKGASTYQVVLVPQYSSATLNAGTTTAAAWNGSTGGVFALDVSGQLSLNNGTVSVNGLGFRGGAGMQLTGGTGSNTDYWHAAPATYTGAAAAGVDAPKGEGVAGTPEWVEAGTTFLQTATNYPSGSASDGSMARGAPGNAGGGGTDADPAANDQNAGGGGGGNGGAGGYGGNSWNANSATGGAGGGAFPATIDRIAMGGGGGAGTRNNSGGDNQASSGAAGGGVIFIRAGNFQGNGTLTANGAAAYIGTANDAGGGGGAGGTIVVLARTGGEGGLTLQATGGRGGDAWDSQAYSLANRHGPGGGGGGGIVFVSGTPASVGVAGGANGTTLNPGVGYGATSGSAGNSATNATLSQVTGIQSAAVCATLADLKIAKTHTGTFTRGGSASYTITVQNVATQESSGLVTVTDTLPLGLTPTAASGTGWTCSVSGQSIVCTRSDALAGGASYPAIAVSASVSQAAPATVSNTAVVSGGGATDPLKNTSTDTASVVSSVDMSVTDAGSPNPVAAGGNITYTQVVTNGGPSYADNATFSTVTPANTIFVSISTPTGWSCVTPTVGGTGSIVCTLVSLATATPNTITLVVKVNNGTTNGTIITENVAVGSSDLDPASSNNIATVTTVVGTSGPNLSVTNVATPNPVVSGNNVTFTSIVANTGSTAITTATFAELTPPTNATFVSVTPPAGWVCTGFPASPCTAATVAAGASATFTVVYKTNTGLANGTIVSDTVLVNAANQSFGPSSATATDVIESATQALLGLNTAGSPATVLAGNNITYTQTISNSGQAAATTVSFSEATPINTTFQSVIAPSGWTCTTPAVGATGTVTCTNTSLASGTSADIVVVVNVPATVTAASITANSSVTATNSPTASTTTVTPVSNRCDLTVTNSGAPSPATTGSTITYTQTVFNHGPSSCSAATVTEATPANTTFSSVTVSTTGGGTWTCPNSAPVSCTNPSVPPGSTGTITAVYTVNVGTAAGTIISDTVTANSTTHDTNVTDNSATVNIAVASGTQADLSVTNSGNPSPASAGSNITYSQSVINAGPATASAPSLSETLPANTTAVSLAGPAGWTCILATLTCTDTTSMSPGTASFTFVVTVNAGVATGTAITQTDSVSSSTGDPNSANNSATVSIGVGSTVDLSVTNTPNPVPVIAGGTITYTQVVVNAGPSSATSVTLTDTLPPNTTATSLTGPAGWTCTLATLTCSDPLLASGSPATITYVVTVTGGTAPGTAINDTATVSSNSTDSNLANNTATASDVVATAAQADLVVTNTASPTTVAPGGNVTYTQKVTNNGPSTGTSASFTETTPPNTTFQSISIPSGWTCPTLPAVGGTGTITCNDGSVLGIGSANAATFTVVMQVGGTTPSGTNITDTATATVSNGVPGITTNTASVTVTVANANSADMAIVKSASPNPVTEGTLLTYTLTVTNNGPASATNVTVTDTLPSVLTYLATTTTQGSCSEAAGTVTCLLGTMANAGTATITILSVPGQPGIVSNTATVAADQTDSNTANNTSTQNETITAPTRIALQSFKAFTGTDKFGARRVVLTWKTGGEAHNLGFNVYRELNGNHQRMNPSMIAGSALQMGGSLPRHAGRSYVWMDPSAGTAGAAYWLEDVDVNGTRIMHGPVTPAGSAPSESEVSPAETRMLNQLKLAQPAKPRSQQSHTAERTAPPSVPSRIQMQRQFELAAHPAVKILVQHEGWYRVAQPDLVNAGLDPNVDPATLHLYAEAIEQPIRITGATAGPGGLGPQAAVNFYGVGIDTEFSDTRVYWLVAGEGRHSRIPQLPASTGSNVAATDYSAVVELRQHLIYFSALITKDGQNFFGALISSTSTDQMLETPHLDPNSSQSPLLEVSLQGAIAGFPHDVSVAVNGTPLGEITFIGQDKGTLTVNIPPGVLQSGSNAVTLTAQNGDYDVSLVEYIRITYPHLYVADSDQLKFTGQAGDEINVSGFTYTPLVLDITDSNRPMLLTAEVTNKSGTYSAAFQVPFTPIVGSQHTLLAVAADQVVPASGVLAHHPSRWHAVQSGADIAMVTADDFAAALSPLVSVHQTEGKSSTIIPINDLYDEFTFGEHSPYAIRDFLQTAERTWKKPPTFLLLNGRASLDPRNYLGMGNLDLIPTRIVPTATLMTASDDWFSDFTDSGMPTIATGRLPVSTPDEATSVIAKIASYEGQSNPAAWMRNALMIADKNDTESFTQDSQTVQTQMPASMQATNIFVDNVGSTAGRTQITAAINSGQLLVNYLGHGSEEQWSGSDIFDTNSVGTLTNGSQLPVFLIMDCLNGLFQDVYAQPLGVTLLLAPNAGAVAVVASSGLNQPAPQTSLDVSIVSNALGANPGTLGESLLKAKSSISDVDVRKTYVLFGDPAMRIQRTNNGAEARPSH